MICLAACVQSELVKVDLRARSVVQRFRGIGTKAHGLVAWRGSLLVLDSEGGRLLRVNPHNGTSATLYQVLLQESSISVTFDTPHCVGHRVHGLAVHPSAEAFSTSISCSKLYVDMTFSAHHS
jgi:hypothetical protein